MAPPVPTPVSTEPQLRLGHVAVRVLDMERAKAFYRDLGFELTWDAPDWSYLQLPGGGDGVALLSPDYRAAGPHVAFHVREREAVDTNGHDGLTT